MTVLLRYRMSLEIVYAIRKKDSTRTMASSRFTAHQMTAALRARRIRYWEARMRSLKDTGSSETGPDDLNRKRHEEEEGRM